MHLAAADVHVVGERVRDLGGDGADLTPETPEVVEQPRPLGRELLEEGGELQDVDLAILVPATGPAARRSL
ncbi:MAG: hypothetical protein M3312_10550, partial [Actinomycetota bacterium]|nr:hypothetical protein [Actinomycetota bacterium]